MCTSWVTWGIKRCIFKGTRTGSLNPPGRFALRELCCWSPLGSILLIGLPFSLPTKHHSNLVSHFFPSPQGPLICDLVRMTQTWRNPQLDSHLPLLAEVGVGAGEMGSMGERRGFREWESHHRVLDEGTHWEYSRWNNRAIPWHISPSRICSLNYEGIHTNIYFIKTCYINI